MLQQTDGKDKVHEGTRSEAYVGMFDSLLMAGFPLFFFSNFSVVVCCVGVIWCYALWIPRKRCLHGGELRDELMADFTKVIYHFVDATPEAGLVERHVELLTKRLDETIDLGQVVTRHHWEQVVVDLVVETAREPIHEE